MAKYAVNEEGTRALRIMANAIESAANQMIASINNFRSIADENEDALGPHKPSLDDVIEDLYNDFKSLIEPVNNISDILNEIAEDYQEIIDTSLIKSEKDNSHSGGVSGKISSNSAKSKCENNVPSIDERTIFELESFLEEMDFSDGDSSIIQSGGSHKNVKNTVKGKGYESHHIPARSVFSNKAEDLPTIALTEEDHTKTSSFKGRMRSKYKPFIPGNEDFPNHKGMVQQKVDEGLLAETIKDEIYEIRDTFGEKYDGAIKQYIAAMIEYIKKNGTPKT